MTTKETRIDELEILARWATNNNLDENFRHEIALYIIERLKELLRDR